MDPEQRAADLLAEAVAREQAVHRLTADDDAAAVRAEVRRQARAAGVRIRTAVLDGGVLAVVRTDAALWTASTEVMRATLRPPSEPDAG